jgi:hypothetical protein
MELLIHITQDSNLFNLSTGIASHHTNGLSLGLNSALKSPYLMHALLAYSAQHLAHLHPTKAPHYLHLSMSLQTLAITLFNRTPDPVSPQNCVATLLFSSVLGHHLLASTLRHRTSLPSFLSTYAQCTALHRGIYTIAASAWPLLMASELEPVLRRSADFTSQTPVGTHCAPLQQLISASALCVKEKDALRLAVKYLQVGFDAWEEVERTVQYRLQMIYTWSMLVPGEVTGLLERSAPEALVMLAYYAVLLERGRELWQVGDVGRWVFERVEMGLEGCEEGLEWPRQEIFGGRE